MYYSSIIASVVKLHMLGTTVMTTEQLTTVFTVAHVDPRGPIN